MTPASAVPTAPGSRPLRPDRLTEPSCAHAARRAGAPAARGFRLGDATPSTRFLLVLVVASGVLALALANAATPGPQFFQ